MNVNNYINNFENYKEARRRHAVKYNFEFRDVDIKTEYKIIKENEKQFRKFCEKSIMLKLKLMLKNCNNITKFNYAVELFMQ